MPLKMNISPECCFRGPDGTAVGRVDFTIERWTEKEILKEETAAKKIPPKEATGRIMWCIELLRNGDRLNEHVERFTDKGIYSRKITPYDDHMIIDFREQNVYSKEENKYDKVWFVKHSSGFTEMDGMKVSEESD